MTNHTRTTTQNWKTGLMLGAGAVVALAIATGGRASARGQDVQQVQIGGGAPAAGTPAPAPTGPLSFEVATVKPNNSGENNIRFGLQPGGRFLATNAPARQMIIFAYQLQNFQLVDAPAWTQNERFDIQAKAEEGTATGVPATPGTIGPMQRMMQSLLADRFKLAVHWETREMPIYALVVAKPGQLGPQLKASTTDCAAVFAAARRGGGPPVPPQPGVRPQCGMFGGRGSIMAGAFPMSQLAQTLSQQVQRIVVDKTGLTGTYDFEMTYTPEAGGGLGLPPGADPGAAAAPQDGPSIFTALQEQLGLKLESQRGPVQVLVVDRMERPTPD